MIVSILCIGLGILLYYLSSKKMTFRPLIINSVAFFFVLTGIMAFLFDREIIAGEKATTIGLFVYTYSLAAIFIIAIYINMAGVFQADTKVPGVFISKHKKRGGLFPLYTFTFEYMYNDQLYRQTTSDTMGLIASLRVKEGKKYSIYCSSKNPLIMVYRRFPGSGTRCMILFTIALILIPIRYATGFFN